MKYWKQFWGSLNQGYKRMHYIGLPLAAVVVMFPTFDTRAPVEVSLFLGFLVFVTYFLLITAIYWIKEGFQSKEPTEEE